MRKLTAEEMNLLRAIANGQTLKSHRYVDGTKVYKLHALDGSIEVVPREIVKLLYAQGLIETNQKFPASTYWLTEKGQHWLNQSSNNN